MTGFTPDVSEWTLIRTGVLQGMGLGFMFVPLSTITFATLPGRLRTQGTALYSPGAQHRLEHRHLAGDLPADAQHAAGACRAGGAGDAVQRCAGRPGAGPHLGHGGDAGLYAASTPRSTKQATVVAYANDFKLMMVVALVALPLIFLTEARQGAAEGQLADYPGMDCPADCTPQSSSWTDRAA